MLVLFIYITSLASNEPFSFSSFILSLAIIAFIIFIIIFIFLALDFLTNNTNIIIETPTINAQNLNIQSTPIILRTIYNNSSTTITWFIIVYLLITLIVVVTITTTFFGPLRLSI